MFQLKMKQTDEYERLVKFFVEQGLEFDGDEEVDTDIVRCYKVTHGEDDFLVGGFVLAKRQGEFIIDGIAVDPMYRKMDVGKIMVNKAIKVVKELGGKSITLVARAPGFFRKQGFTAIDPENAPNFFECKQCPQYQVSCHPEVMRLEIK
ncbi:MAG: GNAT family N-acetyltransferase [Clostridia bacterium]|nr:GNAT family N-acetyltransferase [Clostridia bacterium]MDO5303388.1 GNAT family N-acetyltransferase [Clostridia bacterium]